MKTKIRKYKPEDAEQVMMLWLEFIQDKEGSDLNIIATQENAEKWMKFVEKILDSKKGNLIVSIMGNNLVGYAFYAWSTSSLETKLKKGIIYDLYVKPQFRNRGIGSALLESALRDLNEHGCEIVQLTVISENTKAIKLYEKFGFEETVKVMRLRFSQNKY